MPTATPRVTFDRFKILRASCSLTELTMVYLAIQLTLIRFNVCIVLKPTNLNG